MVQTSDLIDCHAKKTRPQSKTSVNGVSPAVTPQTRQNLTCVKITRMEFERSFIKAQFISTAVLSAIK
jgi:hypothetical protein